MNRVQHLGGEEGQREKTEEGCASAATEPESGCVHCLKLKRNALTDEKEQAARYDSKQTNTKKVFYSCCSLHLAARAEHAIEPTSLHSCTSQQRTRRQRKRKETCRRKRPPTKGGGHQHDRQADRRKTCREALHERANEHTRGLCSFLLSVVAILTRLTDRRVPVGY